jgi:hypothetical protein
MRRSVAGPHQFGDFLLRDQLLVELDHQVVDLRRPQHVADIVEVLADPEIEVDVIFSCRGHRGNDLHLVLGIGCPASAAGS